MVSPLPSDYSSDLGRCLTRTPSIRLTSLLAGLLPSPKYIQLLSMNARDIKYNIFPIPFKFNDMERIGKYLYYYILGSG